MKQELEVKRANRAEKDEPVAPKQTEARPQSKPQTQAQPQQTTPKSTVKTVPLTESARPEKVNEYKQRTSASVTTDKNTTLSKLARQYYNNTYCWVYIYIANKDRISNPNALTPGTQLIIPELTEKEMRITKDESLFLYGSARQNK